MRIFATALLAGLTLTSGAYADIFDDFNDGNDNNAGNVWTRQSPLAGFGAGAVFSFPGGNSYQIFAPTSPAPGTVGPARGGSVRLDETYTNFFQRVDIVDWDETQTSMAMGFLARAAQFGLGTTDGYICVLEADGDFYISTTLNEQPAATPLAVNTSFNLDPSADYRITFSGTGTSLSAQLFNLVDLSTPMATLNANDATYLSGNSGVFIYDGVTGGTGTATAVFDNYASAVPEPATAGILALGALVLANRRRRAS